MQRTYSESLHRFDLLTSSNDEAANPCYREGDWIVAERQSAGRGQRGHSWSSGEGLNWTATLLLEPRFLPVGEQFSLSQAVALALCDLLEGYGLTPRIKWTNDIYLGDRKVAGILIEHRLSGGCLSRTMVGVGLNINQLEFDASLPNPISLRQALGRMLDREEVGCALWQALIRRYEQLRAEGAAPLQQAYHTHLYRLGDEQRFRLPSGEEFVGVICRVEPTGGLVVAHPDGEQRSYLFREIEFLIAPNSFPVSLSNEK